MPAAVCPDNPPSKAHDLLLQEGSPPSLSQRHNSFSFFYPHLTLIITFRLILVNTALTPTTQTNVNHLGSRTQPSVPGPPLHLCNTESLHVAIPAGIIELDRSLYIQLLLSVTNAIMKLRFLLLTVFLTSDLLIEATSIPPSVKRFSDRLDGRRRKKKPVSAQLTEEGWPKYFHEPGGTDLSNHYDSRYEHGVLSYEEKQDTQVHMMRAYLDFFRKNGIETWLAHGTLLGWWWNGKMLPWDWDIDTQVSGPSLMYLGQHFNGSIYDYSSKDSDPDAEAVVERQYLLDVNPAIVERDRGNGNNVIDARWIDIRNGLYIDVTGLSETEPSSRPGVWTCKNYHHYKTTDLYPMRESLYEGVVAKVPYAYDRILAEEYQEKALVVTEYEGHKWHPEIKEWVKKTAAEIKQERLDRQAARRKKQEDKAQKSKEKMEKAEQEHQEARLKAEAEAKANGNAVIEGPQEQIHDDQGIKEPAKEPHKKRNAQPEPEPEADLDESPLLERETSGLKHLRRRRLGDVI